MDQFDDGEFQYKDATFTTGIDSFVDIEWEPLKLPDVVNYVALRETCLSEAPFVNKLTRKFWKKWLDSSQYITVLAASLKIILNCINDVGMVNTYDLYAIHGNPLMEQMSVCIAEMLIMDRSRYSRSHDTLFRRMPELLCYMLVNSMHSCAPRQARVINSIGFREMLLDWISELVGGIRITNCRKDRDWLFSDAHDIAVVVVQTPTTTDPNSPKLDSSIPSSQPRRGSVVTGKARTLPSLSEYVGRNNTNSYNNNMHTQSSSSLASKNVNARHGGAVSTFSVENSPLVSLYMNLGRTPGDRGYVCCHPMRLLLTTLPNRPLTSMQPESLISQGVFREKKIIDEQFTRAMKASTSKRKQILKQFESQQHLLKQDLHRSNDALRIQLALLEKKPVTKKQLIAAATTSLDAARYIGQQVNGDGTENNNET